MAFATQIKAKVNQLSAEAVSDGDEADLRQTRLGQLLTADWKENLLLAGKVWRVTVGAFTAGQDVTMITGGGGTNTLEVEQPEILVGVDAGYFLIPLEVHVSVQSATVAVDNYMRILAMIDRTQSPPTSLTGAIETPENLLDGGPAFPGRAYSAVTVDITVPILSELLAYRTKQSVEMVLNGTATNITAPVWNDLSLDYEPDVPSLAKGPCGLCVYWGGTIATKGLATATFAAIPVSWVE